MALNTVLVSIASITMAADCAVVMNPSIDNRIGVPKLESALYAPMAQRDSKLSVQFHSARISEVLNWLQAHGFNYIVNDGDFAQGKTLSLNIVNQTVGSVADAVAIALGGHWENVNGVHIYKKGDPSAGWMKNSTTGPMIWTDGAPAIKELQDKDVEKLFGKDFQKSIQGQFGPEFQMKIQKEFGPEFQKKIEDQFGSKFQKQMQDQFGPEFQKKLREKSATGSDKDMEKLFGPEFQMKIEKEFGPEFQKKIEDQFGSKFQKQMQDQFGPEFQKKLRERSATGSDKDIEKLFGPEFQMKIQKEFGPEFQKKLREKSATGSDKDIEKLFGPEFQMKIEKNFGPEFQKKIEDQFDQKFQKQMQEMADKIQRDVAKDKSFKFGGDSPFDNQGRLFLRTSPSQPEKSHFNLSTGGSFDTLKFISSLTPDEKDEQRKQGYVWFNDLTREQKLMFSQFNGKFDLSLKVNGEEIRVRRN